MLFVLKMKTNNSFECCNVFYKCLLKRCKLSNSFKQLLGSSPKLNL